MAAQDTREVEAVVGQDPRQEALDLLDGAWNSRLADAQRHGAFGTEPQIDESALASTQLAAAQIAALLYVGDQVGGLIRELRDSLPYAGQADA